jgi:hypothetical protein
MIADVNEERRPMTAPVRGQRRQTAPAFAALGMVAALNGCIGYRATAIRGDGLPAVVAVAEKNTRKTVVVPDPNGKPVFVDPGFQSVEVRDNSGATEVYQTPVRASFQGTNLVIQTSNNTRSYAPDEVDTLRLRYERAVWARQIGGFCAIIGTVASLAGGLLGIVSLAINDQTTAVQMGQAGLSLFFGGIGLQAVGIALLTAGPDEPPPVWPPAAQPSASPARSSASPTRPRASTTPSLVIGLGGARLRF